jgi:prolyl oligopeptidase
MAHRAEYGRTSLLLTLLFGPVGLTACGGPYPAPPPTDQVVVVDTIHGVEFEDPFRWLEDQDSPATRRWIDAQNAYATRVVSDTALLASLRMRLRELMDVEAIGSPRRAGEYEYFTMQRRGEELETIYRRPAPPRGSEEKITADGDYEVVLDPYALDPAYRKRVQISALSDDGRLMVYAVRNGGADEVELRVRNLDAAEDLAELYPWALYDDVFFEDHGSEAFYYIRRSRETGPRLYRHVIGTDPATDEVVWGDGFGPTTFIGARMVDDGRSFLLTAQHGWARHEFWVMDRNSRRVRPIVTAIDAHLSNIDWSDDQDGFPSGAFLARTDYEAPNYRLVAIDPNEPQPAHWRTVIPEQDDVYLSHSTIEGRYYVSYLHNVGTRIRVFEKDGTPVGEVEVPEHFSATIRNAPGDHTAYLTLRSFTTPATEYLVNLETGEREISESAKVTFATDDYVVRQVWYPSKDGTQVPMHIVYPRGLDLTGDHPTLLYGYGGFTLAMRPGFSALAAVWLEWGGVYAVANIRGGNEFGERWHRAGMLENKQNVFDDFIGAAEWLIDNGYTNPERLAIRGGSNGGLLVAAALTQRPDLYRAVLCQFPDLDMVRFYQFTETNNMPALLEYGDASDPAQFEYLRLYSPYENVRNGTKYPAVMFATGDLDTRVPPLQARKMTARLQSASRSGLPIILHYDAKGGHAANRGRPMSLAIEDTAMELAFLIMQTGSGR